MNLSPANDQNKRKSTAAQKVWVGIRFVLFGVGGFLLLFISWIALIEEFSSPPDHLMNPFLALPLAFVGSLMMLFGAGEWKRWAYLWVFVSTPIVITIAFAIPWPKWLDNFAEEFFDMGGKFGGVLFFTLPSVVSYIFVRRYYRRREGGKNLLTQHSLEMSVSQEKDSN